MTKRNRIMIGAAGGVALLTAAAALAVNAADRNSRFMGADLNKDGQVTSAEIQQAAQQRFAAFDVNRDGQLAGAEIGLMREARQGRRGGERRGGAKRGGPEGRPDAAERTAPGQHPSAQPRRELRHDFDGSGAISLAEYQRGMATRYILLDTNRDGTVSAQEFETAPRGRRGGGMK